MPKQRGRKSAEELKTTPNTGTVEPLAPAPKELGAEAAALWRSLISCRPAGFYGPGDLPLLREYCYTVATLLPRVNEQIEEDPDFKLLEAREKMIRVAASLAGKLRICVSSRTRPDTASMRDSLRSRKPLWE